MSTDLVLRNADMERVHDVPGIASIDAHPKAGGVQVIVKFENGFGASVIQTPYSYGGTAALWEIAVLDRSGGLTYETPITDDVMGHLSGDEVVATLRRISELVPEVATNEH